MKGIRIKPSLLFLMFCLLASIVRAQALELTEAEQQWLKVHPVIKMGVDTGYGPYSFLDEQGHPRGAAIDFLTVTSKLLGIKFQLDTSHDWAGLMQAMNEKSLDAVATVAYLPEREKFLKFTDNYLITPLVILTKDNAPQLHSLNELEHMRLALVKGYSSSQRLLKKYPHLKPYYVKTPVEGMRALELNFADAYVGVLGVNTFMAHRNGITGLKINAAFDMTDNGQTIAVRKDWPLLASSLNKALKVISVEQRNAIFNRWLPLQASEITRLTSPSVANKIFPWLLGGFILAIFGYLVVFFWNRQLQSSLDKRLREISKQRGEINRLNAYLNAMVDASTDAIFIKNCEGVYQIGNSVLTELLDKPLEQIIGSDDFSLFPKHLAEQFRADDKKVCTNGKTITFEEQVVKPNGNSLPYLTTKGPLFMNSELVGIFGISRDISELKQVQNELERSRDDLDIRVKERTHQLEEANRELETFTYSVSHDLKAPLRGIDGYSRMLQEDYADKLDDEAQYFLKRLRYSAQHMSELIDDLLAYSRLERRDMQSQSTTLNAVVERVQSEFTEDLKKVELEKKIDDIKLNIDTHTLSLIVRNLLDNAIKFSKNTTDAKVTITAEQTGGNVVLKVWDNGIGFDMKFHDRIFEIFQRLQREEDYPGTGIGLAIAMKAANRLKGQLRAESTLGKGTTFYFEFPQASE